MLVRNKKNKTIWKCDIFSKEYRKIINTYPVIDSQIIDKMPPIIGFDEVSLFQTNRY